MEAFTFQLYSTLTEEDDLKKLAKLVERTREFLSAREKSFHILHAARITSFECFMQKMTERNMIPPGLPPEEANTVIELTAIPRNSEAIKEILKHERSAEEAFIRRFCSIFFQVADNSNMIFFTSTFFQKGVLALCNSKKSPL